MKILAIVGSLRKASISGQLAEAARKSVERVDRFVDFDILNWDDVPVFNEDVEFPPPESVSRARKAVLAADGVWIFTPEYNHAIPGPLKNLLDWLSRPLSSEQGSVLFGKPFAISGASIAFTGTSHAQDQLIFLLNFLGADVMNNPRLTVGSVGSQMDGGVLHLSDSQPYLDRQAEAFVQYLRKPASEEDRRDAYRPYSGLA